MLTDSDTSSKTVLFVFYLELSHHRGIIFLIFSLSSLEFESAAEISETLKLWNLLEFTVIHLKTTQHNNTTISQMENHTFFNFL